MLGKQCKTKFYAELYPVFGGPSRDFGVFGTDREIVLTLGTNTYVRGIELYKNLITLASVVVFIVCAQCQ